MRQRTSARGVPDALHLARHELSVEGGIVVERRPRRDERRIARACIPAPSTRLREEQPSADRGVELDGATCLLLGLDEGASTQRDRPGDEAKRRVVRLAREQRTDASLGFVELAHGDEERREPGLREPTNERVHLGRGEGMEALECIGERARRIPRELGPGSRAFERTTGLDRGEGEARRGGSGVERERALGQSERGGGPSESKLAPREESEHLDVARPEDLEAEEVRASLRDRAVPHEKASQREPRLGPTRVNRERALERRAGLVVAPATLEHHTEIRPRLDEVLAQLHRMTQLSLGRVQVSPTERDEPEVRARARQARIELEGEPETRLGVLQIAVREGARPLVVQRPRGSTGPRRPASDRDHRNDAEPEREPTEPMCSEETVE